MLLKVNETTQLYDQLTNKFFTVEPDDLLIIQYKMVYKAEISTFDEYVIDFYHVISLRATPVNRRIRIAYVPFQMEFTNIVK